MHRDQTNQEQNSCLRGCQDLKVGWHSSTRHRTAMPATILQRVSALLACVCPVPIVKYLEHHLCVNGTVVLTGREVVATQSPSTPNTFREQADALVCVQSLRVQTATNGAACPHPGKESTHCVRGGLVDKDADGKPA